MLTVSRARRRLHTRRTNPGEGRGRSVEGIVADTTNDTDNDGLTDAEEVLTKADSDGDGVTDGLQWRSDVVHRRTPSPGRRRDP